MHIATNLKKAWRSSQLRGSHARAVIANLCYVNRVASIGSTRITAILPGAQTILDFVGVETQTAILSRVSATSLF